MSGERARTIRGNMLLMLLVLGVVIGAAGGLYTNKAEAYGGWHIEADGDSQFAEETYRTLSAGPGHVVGIKNDGTLWTWGTNRYGELGIGQTDASAHPEPAMVTGFPSGTRFIDAAAGGDLDPDGNPRGFTIALDANGQVWAWGYNGDGRLGLGTEAASDTEDRDAPAKLASDELAPRGGFGPKVTGVYAGSDFAGAVTVGYGDGFLTDLYTWGNAADGRLGRTVQALFSDSPGWVGGIPRNMEIIDAAFGDGHALVFQESHEGQFVIGWGRNDKGQLGLETSESRETPVVLVSSSTSIIPLQNDDRIRSIAAGSEYSALLLGTSVDGVEEDAVWTWGANDAGQIGNREISPGRAWPQEVFTKDKISAITAGPDYMLAAVREGSDEYKLYGWGDNTKGKLGNASNENPLEAGPVVTISNQRFAALAAGLTFAFAQESETDKLYGWGANDLGQLGNGRTDTGSVAHAVIPVSKHGAVFESGAMKGYGEQVPLSFHYTADYRKPENAPLVIRWPESFYWNGTSGTAFAVTANGAPLEVSSPIAVDAGNRTIAIPLAEAIEPGMAVAITSLAEGFTLPSGAGDYAFYLSASSQAHAYAVMSLSDIEILNVSASSYRWEANDVQYHIEFFQRGDVPDERLLVSFPGEMDETTHTYMNGRPINASADGWLYISNPEATKGNKAVLDISGVTNPYNSEWFLPGAGEPDSASVTLKYETSSAESRYPISFWTQSDAAVTLNNGATVTGSPNVKVNLTMENIADFRMRLSYDGIHWPGGWMDAANETKLSFPDTTVGLKTVFVQLEHKTEPLPKPDLFSASIFLTSSAFPDGLSIEAGGAPVRTVETFEQGRTVYTLNLEHAFGLPVSIAPQLKAGATFTARLDNVDQQANTPILFDPAALTVGQHYLDIEISNEYGTPPQPVANRITVLINKAPALAPGGSQIAGTGEMTVAVRPDGSVWQWGRTPDGIVRNRPVPVEGLSGVVAVAAGKSHVVVLKNDGTVWGWGLNGSGQLGIGTYSEIPIATPVAVRDPNAPDNPDQKLSNVVAIAATDEGTAALLKDGSVWTWGTLRDGTQQHAIIGQRSSVPAAVPYLSAMKAISAGGNALAAIRYDQSVWTWGDNAFGQLGLGEEALAAMPFPSWLNGFTAAQISVGDKHMAALGADGQAYVWGSNENGRLGLPVEEYEASPVPIANDRFPDGGKSIRSVHAGHAATMAVMTDGSVRAAGSNDEGELGSGISGGDRSSPGYVNIAGTPDSTPLLGVADVTVSEHYTAARQTDGTIWNWGANANGRLGGGYAGSGSAFAVQAYRSPLAAAGVFSEMPGNPAGMSTMLLMHMQTVDELSAGDDIYISLPSAIDMTGFDGSVAEVNGQRPIVSVIGTHRLRLKLVSGIARNTNVEIALRRNELETFVLPSEPGSYVFSISTLYNDSIEAVLQVTTPSGLTAFDVSADKRTEGDTNVTYSFTVTPGKPLLAGDWLEFIYPAGTFLPVTVDPSLVTIGGVSADSVETDAAAANPSMRIKPRGQLEAFVPVTVVISGDAGLTNPAAGAKTFYARFSGWPAALEDSLVIQPNPDAQIVAADKEALTDAVILGTNSYLWDVTDNLTLPATGDNGSAITWNANPEAFVGTDGTVHRPAAAQGNQAVELKATITKGAVTETKTFMITVTAISLSANNYLSDISLLGFDAAGQQVPVPLPFAPSVQDYQVTVANSVYEIFVTPTLADLGKATLNINVNGRAHVSVTDNVYVEVGITHIEIVVTAENQSTRSYVLAVSRSGSNNAELIGIAHAGGLAQPVGNEVSITVAASQQSLEWQLLLSDPMATFTISQVSGPTVTETVYGQADRLVQINGIQAGQYRFGIVIKAQDGTEQSYEVALAAESNPLQAKFAFADPARHTITVMLSQALDPHAVLNPQRFEIHDGAGIVTPADVAFDISDPAGYSLTLTLDAPLTDGGITLKLSEGAIRQGSGQTNVGQTIPVKGPSEVDAIRADLDANLNGIRIDDVVKYLRRVHDVTGDGVSDRYDIRFLLIQIGR
ncbi:immunoglobulin-like domain-containing protein [Paenibacillus sp. MBLB4367]|uniref:RCC1 domain-containing protein n=1 Tax=Paenibacillus sp. MBLB4367 TaxID=3384767 RepID=UPI003907F0B5